MNLMFIPQKFHRI